MLDVLNLQEDDVISFKLVPVEARLRRRFLAEGDVTYLVEIEVRESSIDVVQAETAVTQDLAAALTADNSFSEASFSVTEVSVDSSSPQDELNVPMIAGIVAGAAAVVIVVAVVLSVVLKRSTSKRTVAQVVSPHKPMAVSQGVEDRAAVYDSNRGSRLHENTIVM